MFLFHNKIFFTYGVINFCFFSFFFALNWTDSSVLLFSALPVVFTIIVKHCPCPFVSRVHILTHTGVRAGVKNCSVAQLYLYFYFSLSLWM